MKRIAAIAALLACVCASAWAANVLYPINLDGAPTTFMTPHGLVVSASKQGAKSLTDLGTTSKVLHGNASGDPSWGYVDLATETTGTLPSASCPSATDVIKGCIYAPASPPVVHQFYNSYNGTTWGSAQVDFTDLSGSLACSQTPALTGDTTKSAGSCATTLAKISGVTASRVVAVDASNVPTGSFASSVLSNSLTDETGGGGAAVFANGPTLTTVGVGTAPSNAQFELGGTYTSNPELVYIHPTLNNSTTSSQYGIYNTPIFNPSGASISAINGFINDIRISGSSSLSVTALSGVRSFVETLTGYSGTITSAFDFRADDASLASGTNPIGSLYGFYWAGSNNGNGITSGSVNNYGVRLIGSTAAAALGGTVTNYGLYTQLSSGSGAGTTINYGIRIAGDGGSGGTGTTTNYAIYSNSAASSYLGGGLTLGSPLVVASGGTGATTLSSNGVLYGQGSSAIAALAVNATATKKYLQQVSSGAPSWQQIAFADISGSITPAQCPAALHGSIGCMYAPADPPAAHTFITGYNGSSWLTAQPDFSDLTGQANLTTQVTGLLPVANGGTNASSASGARASLGALASASPTFTGSMNGSSGSTITLPSGGFYSQGNSATSHGSAGGFNVDGPDAKYRTMTWSTAGSEVWDIGTDNTGQSAVRTGNNFEICEYNNSGTFLDCPLSITRATGAVTIADGLTVTGSFGTCTNQFFRAISTSLVPTCATVQNADLANSTVTISGHSLSLGGTLSLACADISNAGTVCTKNTGTSGATVPLLNGNNTHSGTETFTSSLTSQADFYLDSHLTPVSISSRQDNYAPVGCGTATTLRVSATAAGYGITGLNCNNVSGRLVYLQNSGSYDITIYELSGYSSNPNQFELGTINDMLLQPGQTILLIYDAVNDVWLRSGGSQLPYPDVGGKIGGIEEGNCADANARVFGYDFHGQPNCSTLSFGDLDPGLADGSAASPTLAFNTNYGFFYDSTNHGAAVAANGNEIGYFSATGFTQAIAGGGSSQLQVYGEASTSLTVARYSNNTSAPNFVVAKARGTIASPLVPVTNDLLGSFPFRAWTGAAFTNSALITGQVIETGTVSTSAVGSQINFATAPIGSGTTSNVFHINSASGLVLDKDLTTAGAAASVASCGTSPSIVSGSSDVAGEITTGTGSPTTCKINFSATKTNAPFCIVRAQTNSKQPDYTISTSQISLSNLTGTGGDKIDYQCTQH